MRLARVRRETKVPVMADDICFNLVHAQELVRNQCCDVISVYPGKNGGIENPRDRRVCRRARRGLLDRLEPGARRGHGGHGPPGRGLREHAGGAAFGDALGPVYHEFSVVKEPLDRRRQVTVPSRHGRVEVGGISCGDAARLIQARLSRPVSAPHADASASIGVAAAKKPLSAGLCSGCRAPGSAAGRAVVHRVHGKIESTVLVSKVRSTG